MNSRREAPTILTRAPAELRALLLRWAAMRGRVVGRLMQRGHALEDAEDLFSKALVHAAERAGALRNDDAAEAWFFQLALRLGTDEARRAGRERARRTTVEPEQIATDAEDDAQEPCACSVRMLDDLPANYAELLRDVDMNGSSVTDAARRVGITPNSASVRLFRARRALRERLREVCGTTSAAECLDCGCSPTSTGCH